METGQTLKDEMLETDAAFRRLYEQHKEHKQRLTDIRLKSLPSQEDEIEIKRIKIEKLRLKDEMETMMRRHRRGQVASVATA